MHMFPSSNNGNPFPYTTNNLFTSSFTLNQNPNSAPQNPPFFSHFHSPFPDGQQFLNPQNHHTNPINTTVFTTTAANNDPTPPLPKRQTRKKDRHSKILTAQGLRDRRMRLPHQMARKFFNLQDTLGFNRASETIEWLYANSKDAIEELIKNQMSESSMSDCEEASGGARKKGKSRKVHMDKARERARERTREKMMRKLGCSSNPNTMDQIEFPFEIGEDESSSSPSSHDSLHHQLENFLGTTSCSAFNYGKNAEFQGGVDSNNFMGYVGNLDVEDAMAIKNGVPIGGNYVQGQNPR